MLRRGHRVRHTMPSGFVVPAQPIAVATPPADAGWLHEIKHDGYRLMVLRTRDRVRLITRNGHDWTDRFPLIAKAGARLTARSCLIDGEAIACHADGLADFRLLRGRQHDHAVTLCAFDLIEIDGRDLQRQPIENRKAELAVLLDGAGPGLVLNKVFTEPGDIVFKHACALGCEGVVSKRLGSRYESGRCDAWVKVKNPAAPAVRREREEDWGR